MAILRPSDAEIEGLEPEQPIMVGSDADSNAHAVQDIERWCRIHELVRVQDSWLRIIRAGDVTIRRGVCFKPSELWRSAQQGAFEEALRSASTTPATIASVDILRHD